MKDVKMHTSFDPYRAVEQRLKSGDRINRWILSRPRQRIVHLLKGQRVLDVACGTGNLTAMLVAAGCKVVGVDRSPTMISLAHQKSIPAEFKQMDATRLPFHHEFDAAVISIALHEMTPQVREQVWESMRRAVRSGGRLIALDFALPQRNSLLARLAGWLVEQDERGTLNYDPGHYQNFKEFMRNGGLLAWIQKRSQSLEADYRFLAGTLAVVVARQPVFSSN
jgi:ubiquinone/menaquinone biosynthesis C-methylase UbiE